MEKNLTVREWIGAYKNGRFNCVGECVHNAVEAGWQEWRGKQTTLVGRTNRIFNLFNRINNDYILDNFHVTMSNYRGLGGVMHDLVELVPTNNQNRIIRLRMYLANKNASIIVNFMDNDILPIMEHDNPNHNRLIEIINNL